MDRKNIIVIASLILGLILIFVFIEPLWSSVKILRQEVEQKKAEITTTQEILAKTTELNREYQELKEEAEKASLALPKNKDIPYLLVQFEDLALANGLLLEAVSFIQLEEESANQLSSQDQTEIEKLPFPSLFLNVKVSGSYEALKSYLIGLENSIRSMDIRSINFNIQNENEFSSLSSSGIFDFNLGVNVYYQE